ncbi:putative peptidoglycan biosynthesis protein MurJ [bacterium BMS3Abin07]|nr:putative peptidoglycan biosynthesis protein MurJ [bacterium BMS3Abin07]GBE33149.1 putative peptidoglycan biosynthesis protein MurJ [bacterium BMS3Bbin05]HDL20408.1 murein biosynthesis integral membrane protein MurJ [Nitrospirota bacterium]HDO22633.1 murein biosynthesis integral membrane protein MurJ [Nitrospirota bacterium]HDZ87637.1 murein biosynthesis integral membrane protein MurJ [Nitrospirota bacterium]
MSEKKNIARSASLMSLATLISRILGFIRDMVFARYFGATGLADTFFAAFRIPNLFRALFAEGSMSSAFIPVLTEYNTKHGKDEANRLVRITFTFIIIFVGLLCLIGIFFAPLLVKIIAPGFLKDPARFDQTVLLTRIMFPFLLMISLSALMMGSLNTRKTFFVPALATAWFNIAVIVTIILLYSRLAQPIVAAAIGITVGGLFQFASQVPSFYGKGFSLGIDTEFRHAGLKQIGILIIPATLAMGVNQINIVVNNIFASFLPSGSISYLYYAMRLIQFPIGVFGVAMSMAALPSLSRHAANGDMNSLRDDFSFSLRLLFFLTIPSMVGLIALREPIVGLLFQRGEFDHNATVQTSQALIFYSIGIWSIVGAKTVTAAFYSLKDTKTPFKILVIAIASNIIFSFILMHPMKHSGLALANTLSSGINFILLFAFLRKKIKRVHAREIIASFFKALFAAVIMGITGYFAIQDGLWAMNGQVIRKTAYLSSIIILCVTVYSFVSYLTGSRELQYVVDMLKRKRKS